MKTTLKDSALRYFCVFYAIFVSVISILSKFITQY
nr:MAG TPA: hypothetical protein [Bacteriophage sp.]